MRRTTKATSAALGVLAILVLLFSVARGTPVRHEEEQTTIIQISSLPFANELRSQCSSNSPSSRQSVTDDHRAAFAVEFFLTIRDNSNRYRDIAQQMLNANVISDCNTFNVEHLENKPSLEELQNMTQGDALAALYSSILSHEAHTYFLKHQHDTYANITCSQAISNEQEVAEKARIIASMLKYLACIIRGASNAMGYSHNYTNITNEVLNEYVMDLSLCSRRRLNDCQVIRSVKSLLDTVHSFSSSEAERQS